MYDIVAIGSASIDFFVKDDWPLVLYPLTPSGKAIALPFGEKLEARQIHLTIGGNAVNAAVTFSRHGLRTAAVVKTGHDRSGEWLRRRLEREGVATHFATSKEKPTAQSVLLLRDGERTILAHHGASDTFTLRDVNLRTLRAKWWYLSLAGESYRMYPALIRFAAKEGIRVAFNPSTHHLHHGKAEILKSLKHLAVLLVNEGEAATLMGVSFKNPRRVFQRVDRAMPGIVAVTDGPRGVTVSDGRFMYNAGIFREKQVADRTGAGDAFGSGFVAGLMRRDTVSFPRRRESMSFKKEDICYAIRLATANATSVVEHVGATEGILTKSEFARSKRFAHLPISVHAL